MQRRSNPMSDLLLLPGQIRQEVTKMVRSILRFGFLLLLLLIFFMMMLSAGWIQIIVNGQEITSDIKSVGKGIVTKEQSKLEPKSDFNENRLFKFESHVVSPGENLFDLERSYGTNWKVIKRINKIEDPLRLKIGTIIRVPVRIDGS
jgi:hypothetical protein